MKLFSNEGSLLKKKKNTAATVKSFRIKVKRKTKIEAPRSVRVESGCPRQQRASKPSAHNSSAINVSLRLYCPNLWPHRRFGLALVRFWHGFCIHIQFYTDHQPLPPPGFAYYFFFHFSYFLIRKKKITIIACYLGLQGLEERTYVRFFMWSTLNTVVSDLPLN